MPRSDDAGSRYELHSSAAIIRAFERLQLKATRTGRGNEFLAALRQIRQRLRQAPLSFGEPLYRLAALRLRVRSAVVSPVSIHFAVHEDRPLVFITAVSLLSKPA